MSIHIALRPDRELNHAAFPVLHIYESVSRIRVRNPSQGSESGIRVKNPSQESESGIRITWTAASSAAAQRLSAAARAATSVATSACAGERQERGNRGSEPGDTAKGVGRQSQGKARREETRPELVGGRGWASATEEAEQLKRRSEVWGLRVCGCEPPLVEVQ